MALATLSIDLVAGLAKLQEGFDKAARLSERQSADIDRRLGAIKGGAIAVGGALAAAFSAAQLQDWFKITVDGLDALNDLKDATGSTIENISALEDIGARTGTTFESVSGILVKFNKVLGDSKVGSETGNVFKQLGLDAAALQKLDPAEALLETSKALAQFEDDANKARITQVLFGKSVQEAAPFLNDLAEKGKLVGTVTAEQAKQAEDFNKALANLQKNSTDAGRSMVKDLVPALAAILKVFNEQGLLKALDEFGNRAFDWEGSQLRKQIKYMQADLEDLQKRAALVDSSFFGKMEKLGGAGALGSIGDTRGDLTRQITERTAALEKLRATYFKFNSEAGAGRGSVNPEAVRPKLDAPAEATSKTVSEYQKLVDQLEKAQLASADLTEEQKVLFALQTGQLGDVTAKQRDYILLLARGIDLSKQASDKQYYDTSALDEEIELRKEIDRLITNTPTAQIERQRKVQLALVEALNDGRLGIIGSEEAMRNYIEAVKVAIPELDKLEEQTSKFAEQAAANIQDALGATVKSALKGDFDDILGLWENMLTEMVSQAIAAKLGESLFGEGYGTSTGKIGGLIGQLFSGGFNGGGTSASTWDSSYMDGPYAVSGGNGTLSAGGGNGKLSAGRSMVFDFSNQTIQVGSNVSMADVAKHVRQANAETEDRIRRSARQGMLQ